MRLANQPGTLYLWAGKSARAIYADAGHNDWCLCYSQSAVDMFGGVYWVFEGVLFFVCMAVWVRSDCWSGWRDGRVVLA